MTSLPRRILLFSVLSLGLHLMLLWMPPFELPDDEPKLPPLQAKLEPLPIPQTAAKPKIQPKPKPSKVVAAAPSPQVAAVQSAPEAAGNDAVAASEAVPVVVTPTAERTAPPLPRQAVLRFMVTLGSAGVIVGEARHRLAIRDGHYVLHAESGTTGLASLIKSANMVQLSRGIASANGLQPERFEDDKRVSGGTQHVGATFAWDAGRLRFDQGGEVELPPDAQDMLSVFYQLSQLKLNGEELTVQISNGRKLERYRLEVGQKEAIETEMGTLLTLPLRKLHAPGEEGLDIWLGLEYRLLPVRVRQIDRSGGIAGEMTIREIRVSDDPPPQE